MKNKALHFTIVKNPDVVGEFEIYRNGDIFCHLSESDKELFQTIICQWGKCSITWTSKDNFERTKHEFESDSSQDSNDM